MKTFFIIIGILGSLMSLISTTYFCFYFLNKKTKDENKEFLIKCFILFLYCFYVCFSMCFLAHSIYLSIN